MRWRVLLNLAQYSLIGKKYGAVEDRAIVAVEGKEGDAGEEQKWSRRGPAAILYSSEKRLYVRESATLS